jgi:parallel beta-helix repeat protein
MTASIGRKLLFAAPLAVALFGLGPRPAWAASKPVSVCGQELSEPGDYHLTQDIGPCTGHGVIITGSGIRFTLAGHTISGVSSQASCDVDNPQTGVDVRSPASRVRVSGGTITGFVDGISLGSRARATALRLIDNCIFGAVVSGMGSQVDTNVISGSDDGIVLCQAQGAVVSSNEVFDNARYAILLSCGTGSNQNQIVQNILRDNGLPSGDGGGIAIFNGDNNRIASNAIRGNFLGIFLSHTNQTLVQDNTVNGNLSVGIGVSGLSHGNLLRSNTAYNNGLVDMSDDNAGCNSNTWTTNLFVTDLVAGLPDGGPGVGCIQ